MDDRRLPKTRRNEIISHWRRIGFDDGEFQFDEVPYNERFLCTRLVHVPTGYEHVFGHLSGIHGHGFMSKFTPVEQDGSGSHRADTQAEQIAFAFKWLAVVKKEHEAPDLWAAIAQERELLTGEDTEAVGATLFSGDEQQAIHQRLQTLEKQVLQLSATASE